MPIQAFLPILDTRTKILKGMAAIAPTNFDGTETTATLGGVNYTIAKYTPVVSQKTRQPWYMAITPTYLEIRQEGFRGIPGYVPLDDVMPGQWWQSTGVGAWKRETFGALIDGLLYGFGSNVSVVVDPVPTVDDTNANFTWAASLPFDNAPQVTFFDLNWVEAVQVNNLSGSPLNLVIGSVTTGAAAAQNKIRAIVVITGQPALNRATYNTIRVIRMPGQTLVSGETFIINATVLGQDGFTAAVEINLTVV